MFATPPRHHKILQRRKIKLSRFVSNSLIVCENKTKQKQDTILTWHLHTCLLVPVNVRVSQKFKLAKWEGQTWMQPVPVVTQDSHNLPRSVLTSLDAQYLNLITEIKCSLASSIWKLNNKWLWTWSPGAEVSSTMIPNNAAGSQPAMWN